MIQFRYGVDLVERVSYIDNVQNHHRVTLEERNIKGGLLSLDDKWHAIGQISRSKTKMRISGYLTYTVMGSHMPVSKMCWPNAEHVIC
jgi:hypothetical protein